MVTQGDIRAGGAFVELFADSSGVVKGVDQAIAKIQAWRVASERANRATLTHGAGMQDSVTQAISLGKYMGAARIATEGMELAAALLEGDFKRAAEEFKSIPIIGRGATAGFGLGKALAKAVLGGVTEGEGEGGPQWLDDLRNAKSAGEAIGVIRAAAEREARLAGLKDTAKDLAVSEGKRAEALKKIDDLVAKGGLKTYTESLEAKAAINAKFDAEQKALVDADIAKAAAVQTAEMARQEIARIAQVDREQEYSMNADMERDDEATAAAERRGKIESDLADDIAQLQVETTKKGLDRRLALLDLAWVKERQQAVDAGADVLAVRKKYNLLEAQARAEEAARAAVAVAATPVRGMTGATAAGIQALQTGPTFTKMENHLANIEKSNQKILAGGGPKF